MESASHPPNPDATAPLDRAAAQLVERLCVIARRATTECLMTLSLPPDLMLQLGRDLPVDFPETLRQLSHPELQALLGRIDPTLDSVQQSGADNWADFNDRMHFIADLFRAYAQYPQPFDPAFTPDLVLEIKAGRKPVGRL